MSRPNSGSVTRTKAGRWWARVTIDGRRTSLGYYATDNDGWTAVAVALRAVQEGAASPHVACLQTLGEPWLLSRQLAGVADIDGERRRWRRHVLQHPIATQPVKSITQADVESWLSRVAARTSRQTAARCLSLVRGCLRTAVGKQLKDNPAKHAQLPGRATRREAWTYLQPSEQSSLILCEAIPEADRLVIAIAIGTGIRQSEQASLQWTDVHLGPDPHIVIQRGRKRTATKSGKVRRVPLFGLGLVAMRRWRELHPTATGLVFPAPGGGMRASGHMLGQRAVDGRKVCRWQELQRLSLSRHVRWHDLRHTCASSLISGWWGRRWTLPEVASLLGDTLIAAQIYAHLGDSALKSAASQTAVEASQATESIGGASGADDLQNAVICLVGQPGLEPGTYGLKDPGVVKEIRPLTHQIHPNTTESMAVAVLRAFAAGDPHAQRLAVELAGAVLDDDRNSRNALQHVTIANRFKTR